MIVGGKTADGLTALFGFDEQHAFQPKRGCLSIAFPDFQPSDRYISAEDVIESIFYGEIEDNVSLEDLFCKTLNIFEGHSNTVGGIRTIRRLSEGFIIRPLRCYLYPPSAPDRHAADSLPS